MKTSLRVQLPAFILTRTLLNTTFRMVYPLLPVFARGLGVDLEALSLAITARSGVGVLGPFLASFADSRGRRAGMLLGLLIFLLGVGLVIAFPVFPAFAASLVITMFGKYLFDTSMQAFLGDTVPYQRRGLPVALSELGWSVSFIIGLPLVSFLIARAGWLAPFPLFAGASAIAVFGLARLLPRDEPPAHTRPSLLANLRAVIFSPLVLPALALGLLISLSNEVVNLIFGVWMEDSFGLQVAALGATALVIGLSELGGESLSAGLSDRLGKPQAIGAGILLNLLAALSLPVLGRSLPGALVGLFFFYLTFEFTIVSSLPLMSEILPAARATLMALYASSVSLGRALGALLAPLLYHYSIQGSSVAAVIFGLLAFGVLTVLQRAFRQPEAQPHPGLR